MDENWKSFSGRKFSALLLFIVAVSFGRNLLFQSKKPSRQRMFESVEKALEAYFSDCGVFPTSQQGLEALLQKPVLDPVPQNWQGPYLRSDIFLDEEFDYRAEIGGYSLSLRRGSYEEFSQH